jgi:CDP-diacylglycerol--glycerol-3-phosphate 3-phosphatidyltransferase
MNAKAIYMKNVPNAITISRILLTPVVLALLFTDTFGGRLGALVVFIVAAISDYYDGKLARSFKAGSRLGQFLDPFADKVLVLGTFAALAILIPRVVPWWAVVLIAARDFLVTGLRTWHEANGRTLRTMRLAKAKTTVQLVFLIATLVLLTATEMNGVIQSTARWVMNSPIPWYLMLFVVLFTVWTGVVYLFRGEESAPSSG